MVLKKIGETATDILVNGTNQGSYTQSEDSTYDINVSPGDSYNSTRIENFNSTGNSDEASRSGTFSSGGRLRIYVRTNSDYTSASATVKINGNNVISYTSGYETIKEEVVNVEAGDTYNLSYNIPSGEYAEIKLYKSQNTVEIQDIDGSTISIPAEITVDSVNKL